MGSDRPRHLRCADSLPTMQLFEHRVPADDAEIFDTRFGRFALHTENHTERILLSGLPLYLDKPGRAYNWTPVASVLSWKRSRTGLKRRAVKRRSVKAVPWRGELTLPTIQRFNALTSSKS